MARAFLPPQPEPLTKPALVFVEGTDDVHFFDRALKYLDKRDAVTVRAYGSKSNLRVALGDLVSASGFAGNVRRIAIFRDADDSAASAFQSVASTIGEMGWQAPAHHGQWRPTGNNFDIAGYILPDGTSQGELETILCQALGSPAAHQCVDTFLDCLRAGGAPVPRGHQDSKHRFFATVTSLESPDSRFGMLADKEAATFWAKPTLSSLLAFLRSI